MAKEAKEKSVKKSNQKLRRTILGTLSGIFMISARGSVPKTNFLTRQPPADVLR